MKQLARPSDFLALSRFLKSNLATLLAGLGMFLTVHVVDALLSATGLHAEATYLDDLLLGILAALLVFFLQWRHRAELRRHEQCAAAIDEINHHIRNALQVITLRTSLDSRSREELTEIREASARIEWVLRELVPSLATHEREVETSQSEIAAPWR